jgi:hypothetical protein
MLNNPDIKGAGTLLKAGLAPIVRVIDSMAGTRLADCKGCNERAEALDRALPFKRKKT